MIRQTPVDYRRLGEIDRSRHTEETEFLLKLVFALLNEASALRARLHEWAPLLEDRNEWARHMADLESRLEDAQETANNFRELWATFDAIPEEDLRALWVTAEDAFGSDETERLQGFLYLVRQWHPELQ